MIALNILLLRRLRRSLMRTKLRIFTVVMLITLSVYAGVVFSEHNRNASLVYDDFYDETNLADLMIETYDLETKENLSTICSTIENIACESSLILDGQTNATFDNGTSYWLKSKLYGMEQGAVNGLYGIEGSTNPGVDEIVIDAHFANNESVALSIGDKIQLIVGDSGIRELTVVGIANSPLELFYAEPGSLFPQDTKYVIAYLDANYLGEISGNGADARNTLNIDLEGTPEYDFSDTELIEGKDLEVTKSEILETLNQSDTPGIVLDRGDLRSPELLRLDLQGSKDVTPFILIVLLFISGLVIAISLDRLIRTQSREIAVMRTVGASSSDVMLGYLLVPLFLGIPGVLLGILLGLSSIGSEAFTAFYFNFLGVPVVATRHHPDILWTLGLSALAIIFLFGIRPAWKAAKMQPLDVLGQGQERTPNRIISAMTSKLSPSIGLGLRSTFRKPARLVVTLVALSLAMVILGGMMMIMSGFEEVFNDGLDEQESWEYQFIFESKNLNNITDWAEGNTSEIEYILTTSATISGTTKLIEIKGCDVLSNNEDSLHNLNLLNGEIPIEGQNPVEIILDEGTAELEGYSIGDTIKINLEGEELEFKVSGIARELSRVIQMHRSDLVSFTGEEANGALLVLSDQGDIEDIRASISAPIKKSEMVDGFKKILDQQQAMMQSTYAIGALLAIAILFNTLLINLSERDAELATLRVLGASRSKLALILTVEHAFIGLLGGIAGAFASIGMYKSLTLVMSTWAFHMPLIINYTVAVQIIGFVLFAALLTTPVGIWRIGRMDLLEVVARHER